MELITASGELNVNGRYIGIGQGKDALPEIFLAIIPGSGGIQRLHRLINPVKAERMILFSPAEYED